MRALARPAALARRRCLPCEEGPAALGREQVQRYFQQLGGGWRLEGERHLEKEYRFPDFASALSFANRVGELAESEGHHPDLMVSWGRVKVVLWTHAAAGLTENDFVLAAKISALVQDS